MTYYRYHIDGTLPENGQIFVFGSNLAGRHGAGAAKIAVEKFGAVYGEAIGYQGTSYAIPTKDEKLNVLSLEEIKKHVETFVSVASCAIWEEDFFVTAIGCGLAGYHPSQIAPMFKGVWDNVSLPDCFKEYLENAV